MLRELHISNLAVIADARIEFAAGLNCFTGATGAGKSLVIGAIELLLGLRSGAEMLRGGVDEGRVSGVFELRDRQTIRHLEAVTDTSLSADGGELLLTRRLHASGRSSVTLNGNPITLTMLRVVAEALVDVHGQHDHQYLLKPAHQIDVLDQFGDLWGLRKQYNDAYTQLTEARRRLAELSTNQSLRRQQLDLYRFQANEIDNAELDPAEYAELSARTSILQNLEKLKKDAGATYTALYEADGSVVERMKMAAGVVAELAMLDGSLQPIANGLRDATIQVEEASYDLSRYLDKLDLDPAELAEVDDRLNTINRVLNKYGDPIEATIAYRAEIGQTITELERAGDDLSTLTSQIDPLAKKVKVLGAELTAKRQAVAKKLSPLIESQLAELGMEKAKFTVAVNQTPPGADLSGATPSGFDAVEFIAQTNPGLTPQPLRKIASGGEMSRIMLALKGILAQSDRVSVLVFDEIDANVGGRLGSIIGNKLRALASHHQVLCITHLPQIASYGDRHLTVRKAVAGNETRTTVRVMDGDERLQELAEMIGGTRITDTTRAQAKELLETAQSEFAPAKSVAVTPVVAGKPKPTPTKRIKSA
ncbi:MAG TPA: DNA repair protein RecN [Tepidisphaeraceae bacterium]|jgi:DNA repair protein RecN (Recombination protein N)|nr:DNA repair protein RecN [Tepidisphaeraceae bacterium]